MQEIVPHKKDDIDYFETELKYLLESGKEFSKKYPTVASNLRLTQDGSRDPNIQQLLESFAYLTGNLQKQIEQNSLILSRSILESHFPNLVRPIPCMSSIQFQVNRGQPALLKGVTIPRGTFLTHTSSNNITFKFTTVFDTFLFPGDVASVKVESPLNYDFIKDKNKKLISVKINLYSEKIDFNKVNAIRFHLSGSRTTANRLYDLIFRDSSDVYICNEQQVGSLLEKNKICKVGYSEEESLINLDSKNPESIKTLQEFFIFQDKFLYFDLKELDLSKMGGSFTIIFACPLFSEQRFTINEDSFKLRCTPIINLFKVLSEPVVTEPLKKHYKMHTNYLKEKCLFFHSINKLKYLDGENQEKEIIDVRNYSFYLNNKEDYYFYNLTSNEKEPNGFQINLYANNSNIFIDTLTFFADINATNGFICENLKEGIDIDTVENLPINNAVLLNPPSKYLFRNEDSNNYWNSISYLYQEKLSFSDMNEFVRDLKSIISLNIEILAEKDRGYNLLNSIESAIIVNKSFKINKSKSYSFIRGKEIQLFINFANIHSESLVIFSECLFKFLQNISLINECLSLVVIDSFSKRALYTCNPQLGTKKTI